MKHIDNCIGAMEAEWLDKHLMKCEKCREDFVSYEAILGAIMAENEDIVPDELESLIMDQICDLSLAKKDEEPDKNAGKTHIVVSIVLMIAMLVLPILITRWDSIIDLQVTLSTALEPARLAVSDFIARLYIAADAVDMFVDRLLYGILFAIVALVLVQLGLWRKSRAAE